MAAITALQGLRFTRRGERYDLVLDVARSRPWSELRRVLNPRATVVGGGPKSNRLLGPQGHARGKIVVTV